MQKTATIVTALLLACVLAYSVSCADRDACAVFLDANSTTPMCAEARKALMQAPFGNPSASYHAGRTAKQALEASRATLGALIGGRDGVLIFTSGGTEANSMVLKAADASGKIAVSAGEHASLVDHPNVDIIPVQADGRVVLQPGQVRGYALVCVQLANNEIGSVNDIAAIAAVCHADGAWLHVDCVQALGKIVVAADEMGADSYSFAAHKVHGPRGVGALYVRSPHVLELLRQSRCRMGGGKQEFGVRAGTENVAGACAFAAAASYSCQAMNLAMPHTLGVREWVRGQVLRHGGVLLGHADQCLPQTVSFILPGVDSRELMHRCDALGVYFNTGSACSKGKRSRVLASMGIPPELERGAVRLSWTCDTPGRVVRLGTALLFSQLGQLL